MPFLHNEISNCNHYHFSRTSFIYSLFSDMMCECTGEEVTKEVHTTFEKLSKELRQLDDLPLAITSLQPISAVFRHAEVWGVGGTKRGARCITA